MSVGVVWEDPSPRVDHRALAETLRANRGRWARIDKGYSQETARVLAYQISSGRLAAYTPAGDFEAVRRSQDGACHVYVRYLGDGATDE